ncbi:hypothetical protein [Sphingopyxis indica]|uniref:hypothetical protein n=1 Tax=Sphingopyxis indica TaxID=436663 RepID=UPI00148224B2|nr:hypothetical protein [Sphingopyxis indica]WOF45568.1 hypothetical protein KNJ79_14770 [Sphingopyxis indica]
MLKRRYVNCLFVFNPKLASSAAKVPIVERWLFGRLRRRTFYSLAEFNAAIAELLAELNDRRVLRPGWP